MASFTSYRSSDGSLVGTVDGTNTVFSLPSAADFVEAYVDGVQRENTVDFVVTGTSTLTFVVAPEPDALVVVWIFLQ